MLGWRDVAINGCKGDTDETRERLAVVRMRAASAATNVRGERQRHPEGGRKG